MPTPGVGLESKKRECQTQRLATQRQREAPPVPRSEILARGRSCSDFLAGDHANTGGSYSVLALPLSWGRSLAIHPASGKSCLHASPPLPNLSPNTHAPQAHGFSGEAGATWCTPSPNEVAKTPPKSAFCPPIGNSHTVAVWLRTCIMHYINVAYIYMYVAVESAASSYL